MYRLKLCILPILVAVLVACGRQPSVGEAGAPPPVASAAVLDPEWERLNAVVPLDACALLSADKLEPLYPGLVFELRQKVEPRLSGYVWDSRCTWWAGVGSIEFAKDAPTHTVEIFIATAVSDAKAAAMLASRRETAALVYGFQPQTALGTHAYAIAQTGVASLFFVRGAAEVQIKVSDLDSAPDEKIRLAVALARSL